MLTSAVFLRAASAGIPTAQPLKTGLRSSYTAIAQCGLVLQSKGKSSATFANRGRQEKSHTPIFLPSYNVFARPFHASAVCRLDHIDDIKNERELEPICEICKVNPTAYESRIVRLADRESGHSEVVHIPEVIRLVCTFIWTCEECTKKAWEEERREQEAENKIAAAHQEKVNKMLEHIRSLPPGQQEKSHTPTISPSPKIFARPFHASAVCRADCDWNRPCACRECRKGEKEANPICHICKINPTEYQTVERYVEDDEFGMAYEGYRFTSFCKQCWGQEESAGDHTSPETGSLDWWNASPEPGSLGWRMKDMREQDWGERVPISYALRKIESDLGGLRKSRRWYLQDLHARLRNELVSWKKGNRYTCEKNRVDYMDFELWYSVKRVKKKGARSQ